MLDYDTSKYVASGSPDGTSSQSELSSVTAPSAPPSGLYPSIPGVGDLQSAGANNTPDYRSMMVVEQLNRLKQDIQHRDRMCRKYSRIASVFQWLSSLSTSVGVAFGSGSVGSLASGVGAPIALPLAGVSLASSGLTLGCDCLVKKMDKKFKKHWTYLTLGRSCRFRVQGEAAKAVEDFKITDEEFQHVLRMINSYDREIADLQSEDGTTPSLQKSPVDQETTPHHTKSESITSEDRELLLGMKSILARMQKPTSVGVE